MTKVLKPLGVDGCTFGGISTQDLFNSKGKLLLCKGHEVTSRIMDLLANREVYVLVDEKKSRSELEQPAKIHVYKGEQYKNILDKMTGIFEGAPLLTQDRLTESEDLVSSMIADLEGKERVFINFQEFRSKDTYTYVHSVNVSLISTLIGLELGFDRWELKQLALGALLHDIGKMSLPMELKNRNSKMNMIQMMLYKNHPTAGIKMVRQIKSPFQVEASVIQHHERWDGNGYPNGLQGMEININARIVSVANTFDSLTGGFSDPSMHPQTAIDTILAGSGHEYAPDVVKAFQRSLVLYPMDSVVRLSTGEVGVVVAVPHIFPSRPAVRITLDNNGRKVEGEVVIDLLQDLSRSVDKVFNIEQAE